MDPHAPRGRRLAAGALALAIALALGAPHAAGAQTTARLHGTVADTHGAVVPGADVRLANPLTGFERRVSTDATGSFQIAGVPLGRYELHATFPGFAAHIRTLALVSDVPVDLRVVLEIPAVAASVTVTPDGALVDAESAGTRASLSLARIERLPAAVGSRGLESVLVSFPGFAQNANGAIHPRGAHNQMTFVVDGLPISDQLTGAFASALDAGVVQHVELMTGNIPAEFGSKVSGVAVITSRTGLGSGRPLTGDALAAAAGFGTRHGAAQAGGGRGGMGYFASATAMRTDRFLDQVSLENHHNRGAFARGFARVDVRAGTSGQLRLQAMGGRSRFEVANLPSQQAAGQDQRQSLSDAAGWVSYNTVAGARSAVEALLGFRDSRASLSPSPGDTPVTASQDRRLGTFTGTLRVSHLAGAATLRGGIDVQRFPVRERFSMGITSPSFNDSAAADFNEALLPHDLTRGGAPFVFAADRAGSLYSAFVQSSFRAGPAAFALGVRHDTYRFLVRGHQWQPRVGVAWSLPGDWGVLRASYNRNYQTPPNENLLLSGSAEAAALAPASVRSALGSTARPIRPERQDVFEMGYQRSLGRHASLDLTAYRKTSRDQQDNNNFFDTGIIFPTTLAAIEVTGAEARLVLRPLRGVSGTLSATTGRAISTPPFTGGLFLGQDAVDLLSAGPFAIDHDQRLSLHATGLLDPPGPWWLGLSARYDSGLVCNPSDPQIVAADPDFAALLPYVNLAADVPRVRPRTVLDATAGYDARSPGRRGWSVELQVTNLTGRTALYNFQSVFVGTRIVMPRTFAVRLRAHF